MDRLLVNLRSFLALSFVWHMKKPSSMVAEWYLVIGLYRWDEFFILICWRQRNFILYWCKISLNNKESCFLHLFLKVKFIELQLYCNELFITISWTLVFLRINSCCIITRKPCSILSDWKVTLYSFCPNRGDSVL